jgi:hypothetical protein
MHQTGYAISALLGRPDNWIKDYIAQNAEAVRCILEIRARTGYGGLYMSEEQVRVFAFASAPARDSLLAFLAG